MLTFKEKGYYTKRIIIKKEDFDQAPLYPPISKELFTLNNKYGQPAKPPIFFYCHYHNSASIVLLQSFSCSKL